MKTEINTSKVLCRMCGEEFNSSLCLAVFSEAGIQQQLQYKINQMLRIQISPQGNMPKQICHMCLNRLDAAYDLFKMCESVQDDIQRKVASQAQINGDVQLLEGHHLTLLEEKCRSLTEHSPIIIGGSVLKLRHAPIQTEPTPQPVLENQLPQISQNQNLVANQSSWLQQSEPVPVQLNYTDIVPQAAPGQFNQLQNGVQNNLNVNYYQQVPGAQQTTPNISPGISGKEVQRTPRPMLVAKGKKVPRPIPCPPSSIPSPLCRKPQGPNNGQDAGGSSSKKTMRQCQYCKKHFAQDIIDHHVNLHLRKAFFTCIDCNKNFRTECGLEKHRCGKSDGED